MLMQVRSNSTKILIHLKYDNRLSRCKHVQVMWNYTKNNKTKECNKKKLFTLIMGSLGKYWRSFDFIL